MSVHGLRGACEGSESARSARQVCKRSRASVQGLTGACEGEAVSVQERCVECTMSVPGAGHDECAKADRSVRGPCKECTMSVRGGHDECARAVRTVRG